jgi:hypothetical protein
MMINSHDAQYNTTKRTIFAGWNRCRVGIRQECAIGKVALARESGQFHQCRSTILIIDLSLDISLFLQRSARHFGPFLLVHERDNGSGIGKVAVVASANITSRCKEESPTSTSTISAAATANDQH